MDADPIPRDLVIRTRAGEYVITQLTDCTFWVKNWTPQCPLGQSFAIFDGKYCSSEPMTKDRQEAVNALLEALAKEAAGAWPCRQILEFSAWLVSGIYNEHKNTHIDYI